MQFLLCCRGERKKVPSTRGYLGKLKLQSMKTHPIFTN